MILISSLSKKLRFKRKTWIGIGAGVGVLALATGGWAWYRSLPPKPTADPKRIVAFVGTENFAQLPADEKQAYLDAVDADPGKYFQAAREANLSDDQRRESMGNFFMARAEAEADKFFALPIGPQRDAYLDNIIDEMEQRRAQWAGRVGQGGPGGDRQRPPGEARQRGPGRGEGAPADANRGGQGGGRGGWGSADRQRSRMERIPPGTRAKMAEFRKAMRDRRIARGLPPGRGR